jgi:hypothetical protein
MSLHLQDLKSYCNNISVKTLFFFCNDCYAAEEVAGNRNIIAVTAFANLVSPLNGFDSAWFKLLFENEKIEQILIAGHCQCEVINFLNDLISDDSDLKQAKLLLNKLRYIFGDYSLMNHENKKKLLSHHIALQMKRLHNTLYYSGLEEKYILPVKGILIDENCNNAVTEIDVSVLSESFNAIN